ncbi:haloalkane dehalogenase [Nocardia gipuzkoensis]
MAYFDCRAGVSPASGVVRTPDVRFENLPDYPFDAHYTEVGSDTRLWMHYLDERPVDRTKLSAEAVLLLHGEPSWSFLYRHVIPPLVAAGHRCIAPDLIGFGKSDKLLDRFGYTYQSHVDWLREAVLDKLDLRDITLVCQDWGGMLGLRLLAENPSRFRRVILTNTYFPTGDEDLGVAFAQWLQISQRSNPFDIGHIVDRGTVRELDRAVRAAYNAPFPDESYMAAARQFPLLVPLTPLDDATPANRQAWTVLRSLHIPFLCAFSDLDFGVGDGDRPFRDLIPGAAGRPHTTIENAGHFVQEDKGPELASIINEFILSTP